LFTDIELLLLLSGGASFEVKAHFSWALGTSGYCTVVDVEKIRHMASVANFMATIFVWKSTIKVELRERQAKFTSRN
jgi:hypothetical protein